MRWAFALLFASAIAGAGGEARAQGKFFYSGEPVHPGCVHALAMQRGDVAPVTAAVSLAGCAASERSKSAVRREGVLVTIEDDAMLSGGSFGYRELSQLDNGIFGLVIQRILPDGEERVSMAAVRMVARPMMLGGQLVQLEMIELLGEVWIPDMQMLSFRVAGNTVHFSSGVGPDKVERSVDFTRLGRMRK
jgi:hypothetical protein